MGSCARLMGLLMVAVSLLEGATAAEYIVGDSYGWNVPPNSSTDFYTNWVSNKTFLAGDSFVFNWNGTHTATETIKEEYDACNTTGGITLIDSGVKVTFNKNGTHYFLCQIGNHCEEGQKVTIVIGDGISDNDAGSASFLTVGAMPALLSTLLIYFFTY